MSGDLNWKNSGVRKEPYSMTEEVLKARMKRRHCGRYITQLFACLTVSIGAVCYGMVMGITSPNIRRYMDKTGVLALHAKSLGSLVPLGFSIGLTFINYATANKGPRKVMLVVTPCLLISWLLMYFTDDILFDCIALFMAGGFSFAYNMCGKMLLLDAIHVGNMRHMYAIFTGSIYLGMIFSFTMGSEIDRTPLMTVFVVFLCLLFLMLYHCPDSPVFLYERQTSEALKALTFFRGRSDVYEDMKQIRKDSEAKRIDFSAKYMLFKKVVYKAIIIVIILFCFQSFSGYMVFIFYGFYVCRFTQIGKVQDVIGRIEDALIISVMRFIASIISTTLHYSIPFGVRKPLIVSSFFICVTLLATCAYLHFGNHLNDHIWLTIFLQCLHIISYDLGMGFYPDQILIDYLPSQIYPYVKTGANCTKWMVIFLIIQFILTKDFALPTALLILALASFIGFIFCCCFIIDSKGKTLLQIQLELGGNPIGNRSIFRSRQYKNF